MTTTTQDDELLELCQRQISDLAETLVKIRDRFGYTPPLDERIEQAAATIAGPIRRARLRELTEGDSIRWAPTQEWVTVTHFEPLTGNHVLIGTSAWDGQKYPFADGTFVDLDTTGF